MPERRGGEDPWQAAAPPAPSARAASPTTSPGCARPTTSRTSTGLKGLEDTAAVAAWETDHEAQERLARLRDRHVLDAAGFLLHEEERIAVC